jgi:hypothetical protein
VDVAMVLNWAWLIATQATHEPFIPLCKSSQALMLESNPLPREWPLSFFLFSLGCLGIVCISIRKWGDLENYHFD